MTIKKYKLFFDQVPVYPGVAVKLYKKNGGGVGNKNSLLTTAL